MQAIFDGHNTDKGFHHTYEKPYRRELQHRRPDVFGVLEIGILDGGSLRAWRDYFPHAQIVGMDIDERCMIEGEQRIVTIHGDQKNQDDLLRVGTYWPEGYDLIVDDGSHRPIDQFQALKYLWQYLRPHGLYVIEDLDLNRDSSLLNVFGMIVRGETSDIRLHLGDSEGVRNDDLLILEKR
jgi:hypothetical protein